MPIIIDTGALVRPRFTGGDFAPTEWDTAEAKAEFANKLCQFIAADFKDSLFTKVLYRRLHLTFGHIANYSRDGFFSAFFRDLSGKVEFLEQTLQWRCFGHASYTFCDVERAVQQRLTRCDLLAAYRALRAAEIESAERELLRRLKGKYESSDPPAATPAVIVRSVSSQRRRQPRAEQSSLF